jgi:hypothetical protein
VGIVTMTPETAIERFRCLVSTPDSRSKTSGPAQARGVFHAMRLRVGHPRTETFRVSI